MQKKKQKKIPNKRYNNIDKQKSSVNTVNRELQLVQSAAVVKFTKFCKNIFWNGVPIILDFLLLLVIS